MRVLVAPKAFQDGPRAARVGEAISSGIEQVQPGTIVNVLPLADGGDGTFDVVATLLAAEIEVLEVADLYGRATTAHFGLTGQGIAVIEMAHAAGDADVNPVEDNPMIASTFGVGQLINHALDRGARQILLGAGGSGTVDVGAGALAALGVTFHDERGRKLDPTPSGLERLATIDVDNLDPRLGKIPLLVLSDTTVPLVANLRVYGARKGVNRETAPLLAAVIARMGQLADARGSEILSSEWVGAGGGLAAGLYAFADAKVIPGARFVMQLAEFDKALATADLVFTAGGQLNRETYRGKVPYEVVQAAAHQGTPATLITEPNQTMPLPEIPANCRYAAMAASEKDGFDIVHSLTLAAARSLTERT